MNQTDEFNRRIAKQYMQSQNHQDLPQLRAIISFSGVPGSGKTTLARKLTKDLSAQYISHDMMRDIIRSEGKRPENFSMISISRIVRNSIMDSQSNKRIILDASIDRSWKKFFEDAELFKVKHPIIIRFNIPVETLRNRQLQRDGKVNSQLDTFVKQYETCKKLVTADIELDEDYDYDEVLLRVKQLLAHG